MFRELCACQSQPFIATSFTHRSYFAALVSQCEEASVGHVRVTHNAAGVSRCGRPLAFGADFICSARFILFAGVALFFGAGAALVFGEGAECVLCVPFEPGTL